MNNFEELLCSKEVTGERQHWMVRFSEDEITLKDTKNVKFFTLVLRF